MTVNYVRNRRNPITLPTNLDTVVTKPINFQKYKHLQNLLQWVPKVFHDFYKNLKHSEKETDAEPEEIE